MSHWYPSPDPMAAAGQAREAFREAFGGEPDGVWAAPGRVNLIGEHVDYNGGLCLPIALPQSTVAAVRRRGDDVVHVTSTGKEPWRGTLGEIAPGQVKGWAGYAVGVPWALARGAAGPQSEPLGQNGFEAAIVSQVPIGAGLSSSAALECAIVLALDDLAAQRSGRAPLGHGDAGRARLARACVHAENEIAGAPTGGMDQAASLRARAGHALSLDCRDFSVRHVPFEAAGAGLAVLVMDTRVHHALVDGRYGSRREVCREAAATLGVASLREVAFETLDDALARLDHDEHRRRVRHVVSEIERVRRAVAVLRSGRLGGLGPLLDASHASLREDYQVSCAELDLACDAARDAGALGARMTGGGFGGAAIALVRAASAELVADRVANAFAATGFADPAFLLATPAGAARRLA